MVNVNVFPTLSATVTYCSYTIRVVLGRVRKVKAEPASTPHDQTNKHAMNVQHLIRFKVNRRNMNVIRYSLMIMQFRLSLSNPKINCLTLVIY